MKLIVGWSLLAASLLALTGCPEKKPEGGGVTLPSSSATPAKGTTPGAGGW